MVLECTVVEGSPGRPEEMASFFNLRAGTYDEHMREVVASLADFYASVSAPIPCTARAIEVLDLGCGTGLELSGLFARAPQARVTGIDLSQEMVALLLAKYPAQRAQIGITLGSFLSLPLGTGAFDVALSVMAMHHLLPDDKLILYRKIRAALKPGGLYVEGDYVERPELEVRWRADYLALKGMHGLRGDGLYHYDIPCSLQSEEQLFREAGFAEFSVLWQEGTAAIYTVR
jgi:tRNA (cmo5U34)-methyltransferase